MSGKLTVEQVLEAVKGSGGIITSIAGKLDCSWHTVKKFIDETEDEELKLAYRGNVKGYLTLRKASLWNR